MSSLFILFNVAVFAIGLLMIHMNYKKDEGWMTPPVLSGIAFVLIALPSVLAVVGL